MDPREGKLSEIGRIASKHVKVSQYNDEEAFEDSLSRPNIPEDKPESVTTMNGSEQGDQDELDSKEGMVA